MRQAATFIAQIASAIPFQQLTSLLQKKRGGGVKDDPQVRDTDNPLLQHDGNSHKLTKILSTSKPEEKLTLHMPLQF